MKSRHSRPTGRFCYDVHSGKWDWDDEVFRIHGLEPGSVTPNTELVLASKHPDDRERVARLIDEVSRTGAAFSISYRILLGDGSERRVVLVGQGEFGVGEFGVGEFGEEDQPQRVEGFYIDLTPDFAEESEEYAKQAVAASAQSRAVIEQAKGALMLSYGLDPDQAFAMLRWWSRNRNVKVRDLAERIVVLATEGEATDEGLRRSIDSALHDLTE